MQLTDITTKLINVFHLAELSEQEQVKTLDSMIQIILDRVTYTLVHELSADRAASFQELIDQGLTQSELVHYFSSLEHFQTLLTSEVDRLITEVQG